MTQGSPGLAVAGACVQRGSPGHRRDPAAVQSATMCIDVYLPRSKAAGGWQASKGHITYTNAAIVTAVANSQLASRVHTSVPPCISLNQGLQLGVG